jgi:hypothetical protein
MSADDSFWQDDADSWQLIVRAREAAAAGDRDSLNALVTRLWRRTRVPVNVLVGLGDMVAEELDGLCDEAMPPPVLPDTTTLDPVARLRLTADLLDAPWPTPRRLAALLLVTGGTVAHERMVRLDELAEQALTTPGHTRLLRLIVSSVLGTTEPDTGARVLGALYEAGALDLETAEAAFTRDAAIADGRTLGDAVFDGSIGSDGFRAALRDLYDEVVWRLTATPNPDDWAVTPLSPPPRGLRFAERGRDLRAGRLVAAESDLDPTNRYVEEMVSYLGAAEHGDDAAPVASGSVRYEGTQLQSTAAVAAALARGPKVWRLVDYERGDFERIPRKQLCRYLYLSTSDEQTWDLGIEEEITAVVEVEPAAGEPDLVERALAAQPDVERARHADVDWYQVRTARPLPADEVLARFIDALATAHRESIGRRPVPPQAVDTETLLALAAELAATMAEHGFTPLDIDLAKNRGVQYLFPAFYRYGGHHLVQSVALSPSTGSVNDDTGRQITLEGTVNLGHRVFAVESGDPSAFLREVNGRQQIAGVNAGLWMKHGIPPTAAALAAALVDISLPWFAERASPDAIVDLWVRSRHSHAPYPLWEKIEMAARWGRRDEASALLRTGYLEEPQHSDKFTAVAARLGLPTNWQSLAT